MYQIFKLTYKGKIKKVDFFKGKWDNETNEWVSYNGVYENNFDTQEAAVSFIENHWEVMDVSMYDELVVLKVYSKN